MKVGKRTELMLKYQKAKAMLVEYNTPTEDYPKFAINSNDLSFPTTYIISKYAESVIDDINDDIAYYEPLLSLSAQYYDAAVNSKDREIHSFDFLLSGASAYFLSNNFGSAKVLVNTAVNIASDNIRNPQQILLDIYKYLLLSKRLSYIKIIDTYSKVYNAFLDCFEKGISKETLMVELKNYRNEIYQDDDPDNVFYVDILYAVIVRALDNISWDLLPEYSDCLFDEWSEYLNKNTSIKMLWPAQRLIGECDILRGKNSIVQLPTGVGKTKSIELIIRAAFLSNRANTVIIVAPLRALCNEITTDMMRAFYKEASVNQFSDVLQEDLFDFTNIFGKQILICTPEKLSYVVHHEPDFFNLIDLFVFDEAHMFDDGGRGALYELLITHIKDVLTKEQQLVLLSAVLPNATEIKEWLFENDGVLATDPRIVSTPKSLGFSSSVNGDILFYTDNPYKEDYYIPRIIKVEKLKNTPSERKIRLFPDFNGKTASIDIAIFNAIKLCSKGVAIYVRMQQTIKTVLNRLLELEDRGYDLSSLNMNVNLEELTKLGNFIEKYYGKDHCYTKSAHLGVLPHSSSIPNGLKLAVEYAIKNKHISCVVCTSTLAQGVNIPIKNLLVTSIRSGQNLIKTRNFQNLIGRTARSGIYTEGNIIITDPKIFLEKSKGAGWYRWKECISLFDSSMSENCSSSILHLVQDLVIDYDTRLSGEKITDYIISNYFNDDCFDSLGQKIYNLYLKKKPQNKNNNIFEQIYFRKQVVQFIENHLCLIFSMKEMENWHESAINVCKNTLAYSLATDEEKFMLMNIFGKVEEKLSKYTSSELRNYSYAMTGINESLYIESWINDMGLLEIQFTEQDLLFMITELFKENNKIKYADKFFDICKMWIDGKTPLEISQALDLDINHIDDICSKLISYQLNFFIGNINDIIIIDEDTQVNPCMSLSNLQKKIKYGVPSITAISICEKVFNDRILSIDIANILGDDEIESDKIIRIIDWNKDDIFDLLREYPEFFTNRLEFVLR